MVLHSENTSETTRIGRWVGSHLLAGDLVALVGEVGAGKTHFIKGLAEGVGVGKSSCISSPSYTLIHEHPGRIPFYHVDLFRLETEREAEELGIEEYFGRGGVTVIEWADRAPSLLPGEMLWVHIRYTGKRSRSIELVGRGERFEELVKRLESGVRSEESKHPEGRTHVSERS